MLCVDKAKKENLKTSTREADKEVIPEIKNAPGGHYNFENRLGMNKIIDTTYVFFSIK
ncbi:MAG TPA: hypothetical protein VI548_07145 [Chitinophagaceae bacterium]|nr:hypothetical protein [Chitinophagaceae bacterium]